jgi:hypothetical protein
MKENVLENILDDAGVVDTHQTDTLDLKELLNVLSAGKKWKAKH